MSDETQDLPDISAARLAEDVAYRLACREMVKLLQAEHVAEQERRQGQRRKAS